MIVTKLLYYSQLNFWAFVLICFILYNFNATILQTNT